MTAFSVDLDALRRSVGEMGRCGAALDVLLDELARQVADLHTTWCGDAASAQVAAQDGWETGFRDMRAALAAMRGAADVAHGNYDEAAATNLRMWEQVR